MHTNNNGLKRKIEVPRVDCIVEKLRNTNNIIIKIIKWRRQKLLCFSTQWSGKSMHND